MTQLEAVRRARQLLGKCARALVVDGEYRIYRRASEEVSRGATWEQAIERVRSLAGDMAAGGDGSGNSPGAE